jgi:hypothetical protein
MTEDMVVALADFERGDFTPRETMALRFATLMAQNHHKLDGGFFAELRAHFTDQEIIELGLVTGQFHRLRAAHRGSRSRESPPARGVSMRILGIDHIGTRRGEGL